MDESAMQTVYDEVKTPFKYGVVLNGGGPGELVDCPSVFRSGEHWYMMYVAITNKVGYQTFLARSDDLLHWDKLGKILPLQRKRLGRVAGGLRNCVGGLSLGRGRART